jgi:anti-sigma B factor antagonist
MTDMSERQPLDLPSRRVEFGAPFLVEIRPERDRVVVVPRGELDLATVEVLAAELDGLVSRGFDAIVLDLRALVFMDSSGLRLVVAQTGRPDVKVTLIDGEDAVSRIFDITGTRPALPFEPGP